MSQDPIKFDIDDFDKGCKGYKKDTLGIDNS